MVLAAQGHRDSVARPKVLDGLLLIGRLIIHFRESQYDLTALSRQVGIGSQSRAEQWESFRKEAARGFITMSAG
jgi:hypothetical protein